jgi:hypothetical protein
MGGFEGEEDVFELLVVNDVGFLMIVEYFGCDF